MSAILFRTAEFGSVTGRTVHGIAVPYEQVTTIRDFDPASGKLHEFPEKFVMGSFARSIRERGHKVKLLVGHDTRKLPVGKAVELREEPDGLHAAFEVADTTIGNDVLTAVRDGLAEGFSIGFQVVREEWINGVRTHLEAGLREVSVTAYPAYEGAQIAGVRTQHQPAGLVIPRTVAQARLSTFDW